MKKLKFRAEVDEVHEASTTIELGEEDGGIGLGFMRSEMFRADAAVWVGRLGFWFLNRGTLFLVFATVVGGASKVAGDVVIDTEKRRTEIAVQRISSISEDELPANKKNGQKGGAAVTSKVKPLRWGKEREREVAAMTTAMAGMRRVKADVTATETVRRRRRPADPGLGPVELESSHQSKP